MLEMTSEKKIIVLLLSLLLNGCVQSSVFLGPAITVATTGNIYHAGIQYGTSKAIKQETGKNTIEYISNIMNPSEEKTLNENFVILVEDRIKKTRKIIFPENN